jgi:hypothetical protein
MIHKCKAFIELLENGDIDIKENEDTTINNFLFYTYLSNYSELIITFHYCLLFEIIFNFRKYANNIFSRVRKILRNGSCITTYTMKSHTNNTIRNMWMWNLESNKGDSLILYKIFFVQEISKRIS